MIVEMVGIAAILCSLALSIYVIKKRDEVNKLKAYISELEKRLKNLQNRYAELLNEYDKLLSSKLSNEDVSEEAEEVGETVNLDMKILELYKAGYSYGQIAKELGISKATVYRRLRKIKETLKESRRVVRKSKQSVSGKATVPLPT